MEIHDITKLKWMNLKKGFQCNMNYHDIRTDDMLNGEGLRVVLFTSGCNHYCKNCQNPQTWDYNSGIKFTKDNIEEIKVELRKDYISGLTLSGGDPLNEHNLEDIYELCSIVKKEFPNKTIWLYTGYTWEEIFKEINSWHYTILKQIISLCDVLVDGMYIEELSDINYPWAGSTNQRVIDVKKTLDKNEIVLYN